MGGRCRSDRKRSQHRNTGRDILRLFYFYGSNKVFGPDGEFCVATVPPETVASPDEGIVVTGSAFYNYRSAIGSFGRRCRLLSWPDPRWDAIQLKGKKLFAGAGLNNKDLFVGNTGFEADDLRFDDKYILACWTEDTFSKFPFVGNDGQAIRPKYQRFYRNSINGRLTSAARSGRESRELAIFS